MRWRGLWIRQRGRLVEAPPADAEVLKGYPAAEKGPVIDGERCTIITARMRYQVGEPIRVLHVLEVLEPGRQVFVMGPKPVCDEYVDGRLETPPRAPDQDYDGTVLDSPEIDYNYEITVYSFSTPGPHMIQWCPNGRCSNTITVDVAPASPDI